MIVPDDDKTIPANTDGQNPHAMTNLYARNDKTSASDQSTLTPQTMNNHRFVTPAVTAGGRVIHTFWRLPWPNAL